MQLQQVGVEMDGAKAKVSRDMHLQRQAQNIAPTLVSSERNAVTEGFESDQKTFDDGGWDKMYQGMQAECSQPAYLGMQAAHNML